MIKPKPMDPERLATLRKSARNNNMSNGAWVMELLADRDYWEAEAKRWRGRCSVTAEDVELAGVTWAHVKAWLSANGWTRSQSGGRYGLPHGPGGRFVHWVRGMGRRRSVVCVYEHEHYDDIVAAVASIARHIGRPPFDALDEIAATEVSDG